MTSCMIRLDLSGKIGFASTHKILSIKRNGRVNRPDGWRLPAMLGADFSDFRLCRCFSLFYLSRMSVRCQASSFFHDTFKYKHIITPSFFVFSSLFGEDVRVCLVQRRAEHTHTRPKTELDIYFCLWISLLFVFSSHRRCLTTSNSPRQLRMQTMGTFYVCRVAPRQPEAATKKQRRKLVRRRAVWKMIEPRVENK